MKKKRIYTITRADLSIGQKATQSNHASTQYLIDHAPHLSGEWNNGSIICLELGNEKSLKKWLKKLEEKGIKTSLFREPDMEHQITAIAALHEGDIFKGIPLLK
jgi:7-keto-8-aminopelargonate synthetase-like enzyme